MARPAASPRWSPAWSLHLRSVDSDTPSSRESSATVAPPELSRRTASARNSGEYGGPARGIV